MSWMGSNAGSFESRLKNKPMLGSVGSRLTGTAHLVKDGEVVTRDSFEARADKLFSLLRKELSATESALTKNFSLRALLDPYSVCIYEFVCVILPCSKRRQVYSSFTACKSL
jgi:hypothetical protein